VDLHLPAGRVHLQIIAIDRKFNIFLLPQIVKTVCQRHLPFAVVVAVALSIRSYVHQLALPSPVKSFPEPAGKILAVVEQPLKGYRLGDVTIVKKQVNVLAAGQEAAVGAAGVNAMLKRLPAVAAQRAHRFRLPRRQYGKKNARVRQQAERRRVNGRLRQPHTFGLPPEAVDKILYAPAYLRALVALIGQRHDDMVVYLRQSSSVTVKPFAAGPVARQNGSVSIRVGQLQPRQQRRPHVEAYLRIIVGNLADVALWVEDAGSCVGGIAFKIDALIPVVKRGSAVLLLHRFQPCIFARWLVEMSVDAYIPVGLFHRPLSFFYHNHCRQPATHTLPRMPFTKTKITFCSIELDIYP